MLIDDWIRQQNEELRHQLDELRTDLRQTQHRIDTIWWKVAVIATLVTVAVGKVFGKSILQILGDCIGVVL